MATQHATDFASECMPASLDTFGDAGTYFQGKVDETGVAVAVILTEFDAQKYGETGQRWNRLGVIELADDGTIANPGVDDAVLVDGERWEVTDPPKQEDGVLTLQVLITVDHTRAGRGSRERRT